MYPAHGAAGGRPGGLVLLLVICLIVCLTGHELSMTPYTPPGAMAAEGLAPEVTAQVAAGQAVYLHTCARCHGPLGGKGITAPHLMGEEIAARLETFQTAEALFTFTRFAMPQDKPGTLPEEEYWAVLAFVLTSNGFRLGNQATLGAATAAGVQLTRQR
jgi:mono/diheme cytochrome c family protein